MWFSFFFRSSWFACVCIISMSHTCFSLPHWDPSILTKHLYTFGFNRDSQSTYAQKIRDLFDVTNQPAPLSMNATYTRDLLLSTIYSRLFFIRRFRSVCMENIHKRYERRRMEMDMKWILCYAFWMLFISIEETFVFRANTSTASEIELKNVYIYLYISGKKFCKKNEKNFFFIKMA